MAAVVDHDTEQVEVVITLFRHRTEGVRTSKQSVIGKRYSLHEDNLTAITAKTGEPQIIEGWDDRFDEGAGTKEQRAGTVAYFIPVRHGDRRVAVLATGSEMKHEASTLDRIDSLQPLLNEVGIAIAYTKVLNQLELSRDELADRVGHLRTLYELSASQGDQPEVQINETLRLVADFLECKTGLVSRIEENTYTVEHAFTEDEDLAGKVFQLDKTYCDMTLRNDAPVAIHRMGNSRWKHHPAYTSFRHETYIGVPLDILGRRYGTLNFSNPEPREKPFTQSKISFVELVGRWVASMIGRLRAERDFERFFSFNLDLFCIAGMDGHFQRVNSAFETTLRLHGGRAPEHAVHRIHSSR